MSDWIHKLCAVLVMVLAAAAIGMGLAFVTGCAAYDAERSVSIDGDGKLDGYTERITARGLFDSASLENVRSDTEFSADQYKATKGLDKAESSGGAELLNSAANLFEAMQPPGQ